MADPIVMLAPVPQMHMDEAIRTCRDKGRVAFSSKLWSFFIDKSDPNDWQTIQDGTPVFLYVSYTGEDAIEQLHQAAGQILYHSNFVRAVEYVKKYQHPNPEFRPSTTLETDDTPYVFWEVTNIQKMPQHIPFNEFRQFTKSKPKLNKHPQWPALYYMPKYYYWVQTAEPIT